MLKKILALISLLLTGFSLWVGLQFFTVKHISCRTPKQPTCEPALQSAVNSQLRGRSLFFTDFSAALQAEPFATLPYTLASYQKRLPNMLEVTFVAEPLHYQLITNDDHTVVVGTKGSIIPTEQLPTDLATIIITESRTAIVNNQQLKPDFHEPLAALVSSLNRHQIDFDTITWQSTEEITVHLSNNQLVLLNAANPTLAIKKLQLIQQSAEVDGIQAPIAEIDLRFDMPVLRTTQ